MDIIFIFIGSRAVLLIIVVKVLFFIIIIDSRLYILVSKFAYLEKFSNLVLLLLRPTVVVSWNIISKSMI
jgi:hypothetical protein